MVIREIALREGLFADDLFCGHGIGSHLHMRPFIQHINNNDNTIMEDGMVFTIEPILTILKKTSHDTYLWPDNWTITSKNNPSAQFEHMVLVKQNGVEILTSDVFEN